MEPTPPPPPAPEPEQSQSLEGIAERAGPNVGQIIGSLFAIPFIAAIVAITLAVPAGFAFAIYEAFPRHEVAQKKNPGWIDLVFENRYIVFSARIVLLALALVLLFGGVYLAASIAVRTYRKEWLRRAGPFEPDVAARVDQQLGMFDDETFAVLQQAWAENEDLERRLESALAELERVTEGKSGAEGDAVPEDPQDQG
jgi:hypothetical protein